MRGLTINSTRLPNGWVSIAVGGEVDLASVADLEHAIDSFDSDDTERLVVDLTGSSFMDSTGLKTLVMANRKFSESGRSFAVAVQGGPVARLIDLSGVNSSIRIVANTDELD